MRWRLLANPESNSLPQTTSRTWTWNFPGAPVSINVPLSLMTRLQVAIADQHTSIPEAGGVLLGSVGTTAGTVDIHDFICIPSAVQSDGVYRLDTGELERLRQRTFDPSLDETRPPQLSVIGYFRTQSQGTSELREMELGLVKQYFPDPTNVVLLIQTEHNTAGFFCWYGDIFTPFSLKDFHFDVASLQAGPAPPAASPLTGGPEGVGAVSWLTNQSQFARAVLASGAVLLTLAFLSGLSFGDAWRPMQKPHLEESVVVATNVPLQLELEAQGDGLHIRWNPKSTLVKHAAKGNLVILQTDRLPQNIALSPDDLAKGHVYYRSPVERLEFRLELVDWFGRLERESVLALSPSPAATAPAEHNAPRPAQSLTPTRKANSDRQARMRSVSERDGRAQIRRPDLDVSSAVTAGALDTPPERNPGPTRVNGEPTVAFFWR